MKEIFRCPKCSNLIEIPKKLEQESEYSKKCDNCENPYTIIKLEHNYIVDFKNALNSGKCECIREGHRECNFEPVSRQKLLKKIEERKSRYVNHLLNSNRYFEINDFLKFFFQFKIKKRSTSGENLKGLDVGCAQGEFATLFPKDMKIYGLDICPRKTRLIDSNDPEPFHDVLVLYDGTIPFTKNSFDIILALEIIEHLVNPRDFVLQLRDLLKKGGLLVISTPNLASYSNRISLLLGRGDGRVPLLKRIGIEFPTQSMHLRFFTMRSLKTFLQGLRFEIIKEKALFPFRRKISRVLETLAAGWCEDLLIFAQKR